MKLEKISHDLKLGVSLDIAFLKECLGSPAESSTQQKLLSMTQQCADSMLKLNALEVRNFGHYSAHASNSGGFLWTGKPQPADADEYDKAQAEVAALKDKYSAVANILLSLLRLAKDLGVDATIEVLSAKFEKVELQKVVPCSLKQATTEISNELTAAELNTLLQVTSLKDVFVGRMPGYVSYYTADEAHALTLQAALLESSKDSLVAQRTLAAELGSALSELKGYEEDAERAYDSKMKEKVAELEESLEAKGTELAAKDAELTTFKEAVEAKDAELTTSKEAVEAKDAELTTSKEAAEAKVAELTTSLEAVEAKVTALEKSLEAKDTELAAKDAELTTSKEAAKAKVAELTTSLEAVEGKVTALEKSLEAKDTELAAKDAEQRAEIEKLQAQKKTYSSAAGGASMFAGERSQQASSSSPKKTGTGGGSSATPGNGQ
ncbi:hypothetical protein [Candidatus Synchoanobacter obligatus]|uniref:Chromosome partition protein Smc n=1 Tax=Candidatus Synchoanobacter obligatus TaxID=2919597 RepID=A0ABT1L5F5_9GAMM|nr:hypothetical protein [Candidatus Synchoanobacter obligatus]MCP8352409.1 hypothetical protein [Candidatus Synchoanobacter obligatus]